MIRAFLLLALLSLSGQAAAAPLTVRTDETWLFRIEHGQPAHARKAANSASPRRGEVKVTVRSLFGTMMTISSNSRTGYTFKAELIGDDGTAATARTCTLPPGNKPALESWPQKSAAVRISDFRPVKGGRC